MTLTLNQHPDSYGFRYGDFRSPTGEHVRVDVMPPVAHWAGDMQLEGYEPHESDWVLYADGEETGRVREVAEIENALLARNQHILSSDLDERENRLACGAFLRGKSSLPTEGVSSPPEPVVARIPNRANRVALYRRRYLIEIGLTAIFTLAMAAAIVAMW